MIHLAFNFVKAEKKFTAEFPTIQIFSLASRSTRGLDKISNVFRNNAHEVGIHLKKNLCYEKPHSNNELV